jgi:transcriptional regulator with XRE-family HTH domain
MVRNTEKYEQAVQLRKRGFTLQEIAKYCDISKSTASKWLKNEVFSAAVTVTNSKRAGVDNAKRLRLIAKSRSAERKARFKETHTSALVEFRNYQSNPEFRTGLMAYIAAGDVANDNRVRLSSTSLFLHRTFIIFVQNFLGVEKNRVHIWLLLYKGVDEEKAMKQWSKNVKLPLGQFYKNQYVQNTPKQPLHFGVGNTIIGSTYHKQKLLTWVQQAKKQW